MVRHNGNDKNTEMKIMRKKKEKILYKLWLQKWLTNILPNISLFFWWSASISFNLWSNLCREFSTDRARSLNIPFISVKKVVICCNVTGWLSHWDSCRTVTGFGGWWCLNELIFDARLDTEAIFTFCWVDGVAEDLTCLVYCGSEDISRLQK